MAISNLGLYHHQRHKVGGIVGGNLKINSAVFTKIVDSKKVK